ncbi:MAG: outer membrane lipoprotein-sorting protein [Bacteroidetes bacterium]|nr:outer membrane lipoprotein-sorting protein [Bacteroidota bacterium]
MNDTNSWNCKQTPAGNSIKDLGKIIFTAGLCVALVAITGRAQVASEIIRKSEELLKGKTCQGTFLMRVTTPHYTREMKMESWWVGNEKALIVIRSPKKESGNKTLKIGNEIWSYLRNTETTIRIPPSMMLQSWNGSDFTNDDLVRESSLVDDYRLSVAGEEDHGGKVCWKVVLDPKPDAAVVWGKLIYWVSVKEYLPTEVRYFDEKDRLIRTIFYSDIKTLGGRRLPTKWTVINEVKEGHTTEFIMENVQFDVPISDRLFSYRELEKGD